MKRLNGLILLAVLTSAGLFSACTKDKTEGNLIISAQMSRSEITLKTSTPSLVFNSGYVVVREVVFDADFNDGTRTISITEELITTIDLMTGVASPPFTMDIPAGTYTDIYLGIEIQDETNRPSVVAEGNYTNAAGTIIPVRFEFNSGEVFEAYSEGPVTLHANTPTTAKITFDPHVWFSTITRAQLDAAVRTNGVIVISETRNPALFSIVADRLDDATQAIFR